MSKPHSRWRQGHNPQAHRRKLLKLNSSPKPRWYFEDVNGRKVLYARAVMEAHLHRPLEFGEVVHHVNGDSTDDRIENLLLYSSQAQHMRDEFQEGRLVGLRLGPLSLRRP